MTAAWLDPEAVAEWLQLDDGAGLNPRADRARLAAAAYVRRVRPDLFTVDGGGPGDDAVLAGLIATRRLFDRGTGDGFSEFGQSVALLQLDPDVSLLLGLGSHGTPRVG